MPMRDRHLDPRGEISIEIPRLALLARDDRDGDIVMTTTAERWMAEGEAKLLQRQIERKFPDAPHVDLEGLSQEQLETIGERILTCNTLDEVLDGIA